VTGGEDYAEGRARVLVFARDVAAADEVCCYCVFWFVCLVFSAKVCVRDLGH
jgi:hypothetical protein